MLKCKMQNSKFRGKADCMLTQSRNYSIFILHYSLNMRGWRNWQTRMIQITYPKCKGLKSAKANDKIVMKITLKKLICGYGETGKHVWFRSICRKTCRFKSCYPHQHSRNPILSDFCCVICSII